MIVASHSVNTYTNESRFGSRMRFRKNVIGFPGLSFSTCKMHSMMKMARKRRAVVVVVAARSSSSSSSSRVNESSERDLAEGDRGSDVQSLQRDLVEEGLLDVKFANGCAYLAFGFGFVFIRARAYA